MNIQVAERDRKIELFYNRAATTGLFKKQTMKNKLSELFFHLLLSFINDFVKLILNTSLYIIFKQNITIEYGRQGKMTTNKKVKIFVINLYSFIELLLKTT